MTLLILLVPLIILALVAVAIYEHVTSVMLSLPLTPALTFLTILLPLLAAGNILTVPYLIRRAHASNVLFKLISPIVLQVLQGIFTTILATFYFTDVIPSATRECELSTRWEHLFRTKDARAVRAIQEAFHCCGFRTVKHMAWPFPPTEVQCAERFDWTLACQGSWTGALQRTAGANFGVVLAVGLLQIVSILLGGQYAGRHSGFSWGDLCRLWSRRDGVGGSAGRPLLAGRDAQIQEVDEEVGEADREVERRYGALEGSRDTGPRIEPSGLSQERNEWRAD